MDRLPKWLIPLYTRGPFLAFLRTAPAEACAFTCRLAEAATDRWVEVRPDGGASVSEIEVPIGDARTLTMRGDEHAGERPDVPREVAVRRSRRWP